jgi:hypothetical protein
VVFHRSNGEDVHHIHGTAMRAQRNAAIIGPERATYHVHESTRRTLWGLLRGEDGTP